MDNYLNIDYNINMYYDFAIVYWGLTRSTKKVYKSHFKQIFNKLRDNKLTYKIFMHTWKTKGNKQRVWCDTINTKIDYEEYKLLKPDFYKLESQDKFTKSINMDDYFYKDVWKQKGGGPDGEWLPGLILNHICALKSQKTAFEMVENFVKDGNTFKYVMFIRPDAEFKKPLPIPELDDENDIFIPNFAHNEGLNDRFAIINYNKAHIYSKRIDEIVDYRKIIGHIVAEKYLKFIIDKYELKLKKINLKFKLIRP